jgi:flagellar hook protein FlgE
MTFRVALSGLNAASTDLSVTANNIANSATSGFKGSRTEFASLFAVSSQGATSTQSGAGVRVSNIAQQFSQGNIDFTDSSLDLAVSGQGFFILSDGGALNYTRAGAFQLDRDGYVVNAQGKRLQVFEPSPTGGFNTGSLGDLRLLTGESPPNATTLVEMIANLPANASPRPARPSTRRTPRATTPPPRSPSTTRSARRTPRRSTSSRRRRRTSGRRGCTSTAPPSAAPRCCSTPIPASC